MPTNVEKALAHHGVLGMHWGRHLPGRNQASHNPKPKKRKEPHPDHVETQALKRNPTSTLSTAEIKRINDRLQTEKKYKDLNPSTIKKGHKILTGVIAGVGTASAVIGLANTPAGKAAIGVGKTAISKFISGGGGKHVLQAVTTTAKHL